MRMEDPLRDGKHEVAGGSGFIITYLIKYEYPLFKT